MSDARPLILVVDDDVQIRRALQRAISVRGYQVGSASSGEEALDLAALQPPDLVILDLSLPGIDGIEVCRELRTWSQAPILVLSVREGSDDKVRALDTGADDYLTKPFDTEELIARIRSHLRRMAAIAVAQPLVEAAGLRIDVIHHQVFRGDEEVRLTPTEFALLTYLARNRGRVVTYHMLLTQVWGESYTEDVQNLRVHVANLRRKIGADPVRPTAILTEPGVGYRFAAEQAEAQK